MTETRQNGYERLMEDFGRRLQEAAARSPGARRRHRGRAAAGALALAGIIVGALQLAGVGSGARLDVVAQAKAALAPAGRIVHLVTTSHMEMRGGSQAGIVGPEADENVPRVTERWSSSAPTRWRIASDVPIGASTGPVQLSYAAGTEALYLESLDTLNVRTGVTEDSAWARLSEGPLGIDPVAHIRSMLEDGRLREAGRATVNDHAVIRLVGLALSSPLQGPQSQWPVEYDVDPETFRPIRFTVEEVGVSAAGNTGTLTAIVDVDAYEELPLNESTAALLSIHPVGNPAVHHVPNTIEEPTAQAARRSAHGKHQTRGRQVPGS